LFPPLSALTRCRANLCVPLRSWKLCEFTHSRIELEQVSAVRCEDALESRHAIEVSRDGNEVRIVQSLIEPHGIGHAPTVPAGELAQVRCEIIEDGALADTHLLLRNLLRIELRELGTGTCEQRHDLELARTPCFVALELILLPAECEPACQARLLHRHRE